MKRYLFLLRHAEAVPETHLDDIDRALTPRGVKSLESVGGELRSRGERVRKIWSSTALRAEQTARGIAPYLEYDAADIEWRPDLYLASAGDLLARLADCVRDCQSLLLVGHNPGLQNLLAFMAAPESLPPDRSMSTATMAKLEIEEDWDVLQPGLARLVYLIRP